jgi:hypothetical protein
MRYTYDVNQNSFTEEFTMKKNVVIKGKFKHRLWPVLYFFLTAAYIGAAYVLYSQFAAGLMLPAFLVALGLLMFICGASLGRTYRKRKLIVTPENVQVRYKKQSATFPLDEICHLDSTKKKLEIGSLEETVFVKSLKNSSAVYAEIVRLINELDGETAEDSTATENTVETIEAVTVESDAEEIVNKASDTLLILKEKMQQNRVLYESGEISHYEMTSRNAELLKAAFPDLY